MARFLLDTNACIQIIRGRSEPLHARILRVSSNDLALCSMVWAELLLGARLSPRGYQQERTKLDYFLQLTQFPFDRDCGRTLRGNPRASAIPRSTDWRARSARSAEPETSLWSRTTPVNSAGFRIWRWKTGKHRDQPKSDRSILVAGCSRSDRAPAVCPETLRRSLQGADGGKRQNPHCAWWLLERCVIRRIELLFW